MRPFSRVLLLILLLPLLQLRAPAAPAADDLLYLADTQVLEVSPTRPVPLRLVLVSVSMDGVNYPNSLGLRTAHPGPVSATFGLGRQYVRFRAQIGIPDTIRIRGRLSYEVEADGRSIYRSPIIRPGDRSIAVDLDVRNVQRLTLRGRAIDEPGGYTLVWGDARVLPASALAAEAKAEGVLERPDRRPAGGPADAPQSVRRPVGEGAVPAVEPRDVTALAAVLKRRLAQAAKEAKGPVILAEFQGIDVPVLHGRVVAEELTTALIRQGVRLVERGELDAALRELKLAPDAPLSPTTVKELGRRTGAGLLIVGSLIPRGDRLVVHARVLRADTGEAVAAERAELRLTE